MPYLRSMRLGRATSFLVVFVVFMAGNCLFAINSPTITKVQDVAVAPDTTMFVAASNVKFNGNAESGTEIRLFRDGVQVATGTTDASGLWEINHSGQAEGNFHFSALAFDGIFISEPSSEVNVIIDVSAPGLSIQYGNSGCRSNSKYQCKIGEIYAVVSDNGAGIDFSSVSLQVDYADMPTEGDPDDFTPTIWNNVSGTIGNDGSGQVRFYPDDWALLRQPFTKIRITCEIADRAGNSINGLKTFYMAYDLRPPPPTITHIYDQGAWVAYTPGMTVFDNPIKVRGKVDKWNLEGEGWYAAYITEETNVRRRLRVIDQNTGVFEVDFEGYLHPYGETKLDIRAGDDADCLGRNRTWVEIVTQNGTPFPVASVSPGGNPGIIGSRLWPTFTGLATKLPVPQTVQIGWGDYTNTNWKPQYSVVVLPEGQTTDGTAGVYNEGDVFYDANDNGKWDPGEEFLDMPSQLSDGQSFSFPNFRNIEYKHNTLSYLGILSRNDVGKSSARRVIRAHNNDTYPPLLNEVILYPEHSSAYRNDLVKPESLKIKCQNWGGNYSGSWSWSTNYYLNSSMSGVGLVDAQGTSHAIPAPVWSHLGNLAFETNIDLTGTSLPEGTYYVQVELEDNLTNHTSDSSNWFKVDNTHPNATDMVPADGVLSNTFTSFNAKIVDPNLSDGSAGSGANIDVAKPQIWPYRVISLPAKVTSPNKAEWTFTIADGDLIPYDHRQNTLSVGSEVEIWITAGGVYDANTITGTITAINGDGTLEVNHPAKFTKDLSYVIMFAIPFFTSNNGVDRVGAVPVSAVTADGTYVTKVITRDRADNTGTFFTTSSPLEVPVGLITYSFDKPFLFAGIYPQDVGTYTTSPVTTRKLNPVQDGQPLSLVTNPGGLAQILPADANGIPGDGHQVLFGQNGATPGSGQAMFGVKALTQTSGSLTVYGVIGLATGTSAPLNLVQIDNYTLVPVVTGIDITPANPDPKIRITTSRLGYDVRNVPDGTIATCSTDFGSMTPGAQVLTSNGSASVYVSSPTKGSANVNLAIGGKTATTQVNFYDKYPPPAPLNLQLSPLYSNTGASTLSWLASTDIGGAGTLDYTVEMSANGGPFVGIATTTGLSHAVSGFADGAYRFRVIARDADGNIGSPSLVSPTLIMDTVAPPAVNCSDIGPGNTDPDEHFSVDPNIYFYYTPSDDRSGVADVQAQISLTPDLTGLVAEPWVGAATPYIFPSGSNGNEYYARVRVKDRAGNIGTYGGWSNGISVNITGAVTPPNAPTLTRAEGKNAIPGIPVPLNITTGITVEGQSESSNLIEIFINDVYSHSIIANPDGSFAFDIDLAAGLHSVKVKAHNGFAGSAFCNPIDIRIDLGLPAMTRRIYDIHGYTRSERYLGTTKSAHPLGTMDFFLSDSGGSGFDVTSAIITLTDIENNGTPIVPIGTYTNPVSTNVEVIAADRLRLVPTLPWKECLQGGHRYRLAYQISDNAGNSRSYNFDFVVDNNYPHEAAGVPAAVGGENPNLKKFYVYDLEVFPGSTWPSESDLVPFVWVASESAYMIDQTFVNPALVDWGTEPHSLLFNTIGFYGHLYAADPAQPATQKGLDAKTRSFNLAWGYSSGITTGPDTLSNSNSFRFGFRTLVNGESAFNVVDQDWAINRTTRKIIFHINSPNPAPSPPTAIEFANSADTSMVYPVWYFRDLYGIGGLIHNRDVIITDNSNSMLITVNVPVELFDQTVEIIGESNNIITSAIVSPNNDTAVLGLDIANPSGSLVFQVRTFANGYYSTNLPDYVAHHWYHWIKGDTTAPQLNEIFPVETNYNLLSDADAKPFPTRFSIIGEDTADGSTRSFLELAGIEAVVENSAGVQLPGADSLDFITTDSTYSFRYDLTAAPATEGTYYYRLALPDGARPNRNIRNRKYPYRLDATPPQASEVNPADGEVTNSLPSFNARIFDPLLADGTAGSGPNMDPSRRQVFPFKNLGQANAATTNSLSATIYGIDTIATDHVDNKLPVGTAVWFSKKGGDGKLIFPLTSGSISANSSDIIKAAVQSGPALQVGSEYAIVYEIPNFPSNDGIDRIAAVPVQPAVKGGAYLVFLKLIDNSLNKGSYSSNSSIYEAAYGPFDLFPSLTNLYVGLYPPHTSPFTSSAVLTTEGNPIKENTEVTLLTDKGSFTPLDSNGIPGDGHQVKSDASGKINFGLQATGLLTGPVKVRAVLGLASGTDTSVFFVQIPDFSLSWTALSLDITPTTPSPSTQATTSLLGVSGNPVPDGSCLNIYTDLGTIAPVDAYPTVNGTQVQSAGGVGSFQISSSEAGVASVSVEVGGRWVNQNITFVDKYPPLAPGTPALDNVLNNNGVFNIFWSESTDPANSGIAEYGVEYSLDGGAYAFLASTTATMYLTSGLAQGKYRFRVRAVDGAGNVGAYSLPSVVAEVDTTPPVGSIVVNNGDIRTSVLDVTLSLSATDVQGVADMSFSNDGINWGGWVAYSTGALWTMSAGDGPRLIYVRFRDTVGNIGVVSDDIILDTTGPLGGVALKPNPFSNNVTLSVELYASDGSGVPTMWLSYDGGPFASQAFESLVNWTVASGYATHTVDVKYVDDLGNESVVYSAATCIDTILPVTPTVTDDGDYSPWLDQLHASWTSSDAQSGLSHYLVKVGTAQGLGDLVAETNVGLVNEITFSSLALDISGATNYYFTVIAVDNAGNLSANGYSDGIKGGDPTPPAPVTVNDDGDFTANNTLLHATWSASNDPDSGINRYEFSAGTSAGITDLVPWTNMLLALEHTATGLTLPNGQNCFINVKVWNNGGTSTVSISDGIRVDIMPPTAPTLDAEPQYTGGTTNSVSCNVVTDALSGQVQYFFQRATKSDFTIGLADSGWITLNSHSFTGLVHGTTYYFRVKARDAVGNESAFSPTLYSIQDENPPTCVAYTDNLAANNDPNHIWSQDLNVAFIADSLTDDLSEVKNVYLQIADDSGFTNILHEGWLGNTDGSYSFVAPDIDGTKIFARARFEDVAGNISTYFSTDGITLDLNNPIAGATTDEITQNNDNDHTVSADVNIYFAFTHSDTVSGVEDVRLMIATDELFTQVVYDQWLGAVPAAESFHYDQGVDGLTYWAQIMVKDSAQRISPFGGASNGIRVDLSAPVDPGGEMFFINKKSDEYIGEETTATTSVHITLTITDPSGIDSALISNNGTDWTAWLNPALNPASHSWSLEAVAGDKTVYMQFIDGVGHTSPVYPQTIKYYPTFKINEGARDDGSYPVDTYDEYLGQNKYGTDRSVSDAPATGKSLKLEKP